MKHLITLLTVFVVVHSVDPDMKDVTLAIPCDNIVNVGSKAGKNFINLKGETGSTPIRESIEFVVNACRLA